MERAAFLLKGQAFGRTLVSWYSKNRRDLPFRRSHDPYLIWISEIMLQQTRVSAMLSSYERFVKKFPDLPSLALADLEDVLHHWKGLGYYQRARNLHRAALQMYSEGWTTVPVEYERLLRYAGIGPYTAAAIASIAGDKRHAVLDGNVKRVLCRLLGRMENDRILGEIAQSALLESEQKPSLFNQAMMELGAVVCTPGIPDCENCPVRSFCVSGSRGAEFASTLPVLKKERPVPLHVQVFVHHRRGRKEREYALVSNTDGLFLKEELSFPYAAREGRQLLYCSPELTGSAIQSGGLPAVTVGSFRHSIMKWRIHCDVIVCETSLSGARWLAIEEIERRLHSSFAGRILHILRSSGDALNRADDKSAPHQSGTIHQSGKYKAKKKELHKKEKHHQTDRQGNPDTVNNARVLKKRDDLPEDCRKYKDDR
jgi:A/G-specific adenine glycosylase